MEINYGAVFDVEVPETTTGAEETEAAEPSEMTPLQPPHKAQKSRRPPPLP